MIFFIPTGAPLQEKAEHASGRNKDLSNLFVVKNEWTWIKHLNYTIFDTPVIKTIALWTSLTALKMTGWKVEGEVPAIPKFIMIAAPHTSNWDLPYTLFVAFKLKLKVYWMGKNAIFRWPLGWFFKWLGGIPIDRSRATNVVDRSIEEFSKNEKLILLVPPSGTRSRVTRWKTGFYYIAEGANVPIVLGFLDYSLKTGGIGPVVHPTGDIDKDMKTIRSFYEGITGKYPEKSIGYADREKN